MEHFGLLAVSGCASVGMAKKAIVDRASEVSADALIDAEWWICRGSPIGSVKDRHEQSTERANMYKEFCSGRGQANVVGP